jgi:hypothetical protein
MDEDANRLLTGVAWREWCDRLRAAGDQILDSDAPSDDRSRIEGYRALTRLLGHATRQEIEASDPLFPDFVRYGEPHSQWGGPNPNIAYLRAVIDPHETYRIWADVDGLFQAIFSQHEGDVQLDEHGVYHERHLDSLEIDNEGFLEIVLSPDEHDENWIPTHPDARFFAIRLFVSDWENHTAPTFHIERIGAEGEAPAPRSASEFARALDRAITWVERSSTHWRQTTRDDQQRATPNVASPAHPDPGGADNIVAGRCFWDLKEDEALIVTTETPNARYWGFSTQSIATFESGDFARRQTSLSGDQLHVDGDGRARVVLSADDPGSPNWIDTEGRATGILAYQWVWTETLPTPHIQVVKLDDVWDNLPDEHPLISDEERREQLSLRREALSNRFG